MNSLPLADALDVVDAVLTTFDRRLPAHVSRDDLASEVFGGGKARKLERHATGPSLETLIADEFEQSHAYGGRSVFGFEPPPAQKRQA